MEKCLSCGKKIKGRSDKKFCCESCKNDYHNCNRSRKPAIFKLQRSAAKRNRSLLVNIEASGVEVISENELKKSGFNFEGLTGIKFVADKNLLLFCYEYMLQRNGNSFTIQKT